MENIKVYINEIRKMPLLTAQEEIVLSTRVRKGNKEAREKMIRANLRLVINIAKRYVHFGIPLMDLIEEGNMGLMKAVEKFNPRKGFRFSTYAAWWIKQGITRSLFDQSRTVRIPVYINELMTRYKKTNERLMSRLKRMPTEKEIARSMRVRVDKVEKLRTYLTKTSSLDASFDEDGSGRGIIDLLEDKSSASPEFELNNFFNKEHLNGLLGAVSDREHRVLDFRFGLVDGRFYTLAEVSKRMDISRERVRQIEARALKKLKKFISAYDPEMKENLWES